ncbi:DUF2799 domain-containing protein [Hyphococcus luteus]|jgi:tetratricopeptide (TPR) repeat protein|uniref:DUF2799 domain-containing protein n=1 Tax=Hyphococcus luteus TaxID=2058213 RepID=A0A2S7K6T4_9PROT|nr:DUF2799 domain-containing protein [Marinicaulis flavus]PQA88189.1 hypothetical protein CW354_07720 [Marinicaulis flavus]
MQRYFGALLAAVFLSGCATELMSEEECLAGDWYGAGLEDGGEGRLLRAFDERAGLCEGYGAPADYEAYAQGRDLALGRLCTEGGGYAYARAGKSYLGVCRAEREPAFLSGYLEGQRIYWAEAARDRAENAYNSAVSSLDYHRDQLRRARKRLRDPDATEKQIKKARKNIDYHRDRIPYAERELDEALYELGRADEALSQTIDSTPAWRQSDEFAFRMGMFLEVHAFGRSEEAVDFCTDEFDGDFGRPECEMLAGKSVRDTRTGQVCVTGPAKLVLLRRGLSYGPFEEAAFIDVFQTFPRDENGRTARQSANYFVAMFDGEGRYLGAACPETP